MIGHGFYRKPSVPAELRDTIIAKHRSGEGYKEIFVAVIVPRTTKTSIVEELLWHNQDAKLRDQGRRTSVREMTMKPMVPLTEHQRSL